MTVIPAEITQAIAADLPDDRLVAEIDETPTLALTLGDLIRAGSAHTVKVEGWGAGDQACALSAAAIAADALGIVPAK